MHCIFFVISVMQCNFYFIQRIFYDELYRVSFLSLPRAQQFYRIGSLHRPGSGVTTAVLRIAIQRTSCIKVDTAKNIHLQAALILF
jgi:hypothetical protein